MSGTPSLSPAIEPLYRSRLWGGRRLAGLLHPRQLRTGFPAGASYASLSAVNPAFASPSFNSTSGTFHIPRYPEWSLQLEQELDSNSHEPGLHRQSRAQ